MHPRMYITVVAVTSMSTEGFNLGRGVVASFVRRMNEVTLRRARLVLGWVTVFGRVYHHGVQPPN